MQANLPIPVLSVIESHQRSSRTGSQQRPEWYLQMMCRDQGVDKVKAAMPQIQTGSGDHPPRAHDHVPALQSIPPPKKKKKISIGFEAALWSNMLLQVALKFGAMRVSKTCS
jgi:hypothetical protein